MKYIVLIACCAILVFSFAQRGSFAESDRFAIWEDMEAETNKMFGDGKISDQDLNDFQDVLRMGSAGETENAIKALNTLLRKTNNPVLKEVSMEVMQALANQRKETASNNLKKSHEKKACAMDLKICPDGTVVGREGANCKFAACPEK